MAVPKLPLPTSPRTSVFRALVKILKNDPTFSNAVPADNLRTWSGSSHDTMVPSYSGSPFVRLTPTNGPETFWSPNSMRGDLLIRVEMLVPGTNVDDPQNLWYAIEKAIYPNVSGSAASNVVALQAAGALTGYAEFTQPAFDFEPQERMFACVGQIKITVRLDFIPTS
jgi:hypothetical protein